MNKYTACFYDSRNVCVRMIDFNAKDDSSAWKEAWVMEDSLNKKQPDDNKLTTKLIGNERKPRRHNARKTETNRNCYPD